MSAALQEPKHKYFTVVLGITCNIGYACCGFQSRVCEHIGHAVCCRNGDTGKVAIVGDKQDQGKAAADAPAAAACMGDSGAYVAADDQGIEDDVNDDDDGEDAASQCGNGPDRCVHQHECKSHSGRTQTTMVYVPVAIVGMCQGEQLQGRQNV